MNDTIAAISTPPGEGGVGIIRISGEDSFRIAERIFRPRKQKNWLSQNYKMHYGHVVDPGSGSVIDEVLLSVMKAPHTYTRENVVEINCHGGIVPLREAFRAVLAAGARLADPGEFTKRAFINGRIDLTQAESVIDVIRSKTEASLKVAISQLGGGLSDKIRKIQDRILAILAELEVSIDFPEDDMDLKSKSEISLNAGEIIRDLDSLIESAGRGRVYREGIRTVIAGRPNVGKSSLLNVLLGRERAIVTEIPGTTRDVIEETINIKGIPLVLADTAGLRETNDLVEKIGVEKTREFMAGADLVLFMVEAGKGVTEDDRDLLKKLEIKKTILIVNKIDLAGKMFPAKCSRQNVPGKKETFEYGDMPTVEISALKGQGINILEDRIEEVITGGGVISPESIIISNARHEEILARARDHLEEFLKSMEDGLPPDILSIDVKDAFEALGEITGSSVTEDLLDHIFSQFCIGK